MVELMISFPLKPAQGIGFVEYLDRKAIFY
jgi:hypothetical protein